MNIAVYFYLPFNSNCPMCNMSARKTMILNSFRCKEKIAELYPNEEHEFRTFIDRGTDVTLENGVCRRTHLEDIILAAQQGKIDVMIVVQLSEIGHDIHDILDYYKRLKENHVKLVTVLDGEDVMKTLDEALESNI